MLTEAQKAARLTGLGSSDAPVCANLSPYKDLPTLIYEKEGRLEPSQDETEAMAWGTRLEGPCSDAYEEITGRKVRRQGTKRHPDLPWMLAHIDRQIVAQGRGVGVLEIKTTDRSAQRDWEDGVPHATYLQLQHQLAVTGYAWGSVAVLFGGNTFRTYDVDRDQEVIDYLITIEAKVWAVIEAKADPPPEMGVPNADLLKRLYPLDSGRTITLDTPQAIAMLDVLGKAKADLKDAESRKLAAESWIKDQMKDASVCEVKGWGHITWRATKPSKAFDEDAFKAAEPDLYQKYLIPQGGYRRLTLKPGKDLV
jgi:putative phage-type endonuclease